MYWHRLQPLLRNWLYNLTVYESDPPYFGRPPNRDGKDGAPLGWSDTDVKCERPRDGSLAYQSLKKLGKQGSFTEIAEVLAIAPTPPLAADSFVF